MTVPASGVIWGLMWATDRLYDWGFGLIAVPIRIIIFIIQISILFACLATIIGIVVGAFGFFKAASRGQDMASDSELSFKRYMLLLVLPVAMVAASALFAFFNTWMDFFERGLAIIGAGYVALLWGLQISSVLLIGVWLVVLPFYLRNRRASGLPGN